MINFPNFNIYLSVPQIAFKVGDVAVYWYGIIIAIAMICGSLLALHIAKTKGLDTDSLITAVLWAVPSAVIGARAYFVICNHADYPTFANVINLRQGGIAIYGGIIGGIIALSIYSFCKKTPFLELADCLAPALLLGQAIGRWGNFVNREAFGEDYSGLFRMEITYQGELISVHPTFLYESLWCLLGVFTIIFFAGIIRKRGTALWLYMIWYGLGRYYIEGLRVDSLPYGANFKISQIVSLICIAFGVLALVWRWVRDRGNRHIRRSA